MPSRSWLTPLVAVAFACAAPHATNHPPPAGPLADTRDIREASVQRPVPDDFSPAILRPAREANDATLTTVAGLAVRKSDLFARLQEMEPLYARQLLNDLTLDILLAQQCEQQDIRVDPAEIEARVNAEEQKLKSQLAEQGQGAYERYLAKQFGFTAEEFRHWQRITLARDRYRQFVVRYLAMREDRVVVRILANRDKELLNDLRRRMVEGADFATLAMRHSEDESKKDGGLLPPLHRSSNHPVVAAAFALAAGEVSAPVTLPTESGPRHFLLFCAKKLPGRDLPFAQLRQEIERDIEERSLPPAELQAVFDRLLHDTGASTLPSHNIRR